MYHLVCDIKRLLVSYLTREVNVRFGSKADIGASPIDVRFTPKSGHWDSAAKCPLRANFGLIQCATFISIMMHLGYYS